MYDHQERKRQSRECFGYQGPTPDLVEQYIEQSRMEESQELFGHPSATEEEIRGYYRRLLGPW
jgi:hypothetical protein